MSTKTNMFSNLKSDLPASIVVFLVALPLCLGIALASGAPLFSGIVAGIVGGTIVALLSGSQIGVSGPAAGLAAIVFIAIKDLGGLDNGVFPKFLLAVVIAGVLQALLGVLRAGVIGYYFPNSVIKGMLAGIGIIIIWKQLPFGFATGVPGQGNYKYFTDDRTWGEAWSLLISNISPGAVAITLLSLAVLLLWDRPFMKKIGLFKIVQGPLVVVILGVILNFVFKGTSLALMDGMNVNIPEPKNMAGFFDQFTTPDFSQITNSKIWVIAFTIAIVASLETLLCVEATDKLDPEKRITPTNRELLAQGAGNFVSGMVGGLPVTQVIVRSSANIQSGGKTKMSAFVHGLLLLACVMAIPHYLNFIPFASLAAILFVVGFKLAKPAVMKAMYAKGWSQFLPYAVTIVGIVAIDLLWGIGLGLAVAVVQILWNNFKTPYHFDPNEYEKGETIKIMLAEEVTFLNKAGIMNTLNNLPDGVGVVVDGSQVQYIHDDVLEIIEEFLVNAKTRDINARFEGYHPENNTTTKKKVGELQRSILNIVSKKKDKLEEVEL